MTIEQLIFVGLNGYAAALDRNTGEIVWSNNELKSGPVKLLLDGDRLIVSTGGYLFCLDPADREGPVEQRECLSRARRGPPRAIGGTALRA